MQDRPEKDRSTLRTVPLPTSDVTLAALSTLLSSPGRRYTATELHTLVQDKLGRHVNFSGMLKQIRAFSDLPGWNLILVVKPTTLGRQLRIWAEQSPLTDKMSNVVQGLDRIRLGLEESAKWKAEYDAERNRILSDPNYDASEARPKLLALKSRLDDIVSRMRFLDSPHELVEEAQTVESALNPELETVAAQHAMGRSSVSGHMGIAVIGAGYWGRKIIRELLEIGKATGQLELHSVVDNSPTSLALCQQEFGTGIDYRLDYQELLEDPSVAGVHICTPNATHFDIASRFLRAGKNVLVEKPLTLKTEESYELVRLAAEKKCVLSVGHIHRFNNGVRELRRVIAEGLIGEPYYVDFRWTGFMNPQLQREVITDLAPNPFDICNYALDAWPDQITCKGRGYRTRQNEEVAFITAEYRSGLIAQIEVSWLDRDKRRDVTIVGSNGMVYLDCLSQKLLVEDANGKREIPVIPSNTIASEIIHFTDCIRSNRDSSSYANHSDGMLGAHVVSMLEASRESMSQNRTVQVQRYIILNVPTQVMSSDDRTKQPLTR
jgi:UDP-N-acetylglucosamine 3-dehydrogenase